MANSPVILLSEGRLQVLAHQTRGLVQALFAEPLGGIQRDAVPIAFSVSWYPAGPDTPHDRGTRDAHAVSQLVRGHRRALKADTCPIACYQVAGYQLLPLGCRSGDVNVRAHNASVPYMSEIRHNRHMIERHRGLASQMHRSAAVGPHPFHLCLDTAARVGADEFLDDSERQVGAGGHSRRGAQPIR